MARYRRRILLINPKFQLKFSFFAASWIGALSILYPMIIYQIFAWFIRYLQITDPSVPLDKIEHFKSSILSSVIWLQIFFVLMVFLLSLFLSHRVSGPLFKLKRALGHLALGQFETIYFRKSDHFKDLAEEYNRAVESTRSAFTQIESELQNALNAHALDDAKKKIETAISEIKKFRDLPTPTENA